MLSRFPLLRLPSSLGSLLYLLLGMPGGLLLLLVGLLQGDSAAGEDQGGGRRPLLLLLLQCMVLLPVASLHVLLRPGRICNNYGAADHKLA